MIIVRAGNMVEFRHKNAQMTLSINVAANLLQMAESDIRGLLNFTPYVVPKGGKHVYPLGD